MFIMISVWPLTFLGEWGESEVPSSIFSAGGGGGETSQSHHDYTVWNEYSPAKNVRFYFKPVYIFKVHRIINGFRLFVCYRVSRNRHFFFNFTRISNLIRDHKYWITLYCNKSRFFIFTIPFKPETSVWVAIKISN